MNKCRVCGARITENCGKCPACGATVGSDETVTSDLELLFKNAASSDKEKLFKAVMKYKTLAAGDEQKTYIKKLLEIIANSGHSEGMYEYAELLLYGGEDEKSKAEIFLKLSAEKGCEPSRIRLILLEDSKKKTEETSSGEEKTPSAKSESDCGKGSFEELCARALKSILSVNVCDGNSLSSGTAFIVDSGYVVSNYHVVSNLKNGGYVLASFDRSIDKTPYKLDVVATDSDSDTAIMVFDDEEKREAVRGEEHLKLRTAHVTLGEDVYTIGNPNAVGLSLTRGVIASANEDTCSKIATIHANLSINPGNSGGPLLDMQNRVLGITTFVRNMDDGSKMEGHAFCVPSERIENLFGKLKNKKEKGK